MTSRIVAARAALHMWEEPCLSGKEGSGAVFFSGCPLGCLFCQNRPIALGHDGQEVTEERLTEILLELQAQGANNINYVTPTHYVPTIIAVTAKARRRGLTIPIVYNTAAYEKRETILALEGTVDIYLPDYKYDDPALADRLCRAPDYPETARAALEALVHPAVFRDFEAWKAERPDCALVAFESAILLDRGLPEGFADYVIYVDAPEELRLRRAMERDGSAAESVRRRMQSQKAGPEHPAVDFVLDNSGDFKALEAALDGVLRQIASEKL